MPSDDIKKTSYLTDAEKEQTKLRAAFLNTLGASIITVGCITPLVATLYKLVNALPLSQVGAYACFSFVGGLALHALGYWTLKSLI